MAPDPIIKLEKVSWVRDGKAILEEIDWTVNPGEHWAVVGLNGSGKTSLLNIAAGYVQPSSGRAAVLGRQFGAYDLRELRKSIGWVSAALRDRLYQGEAAEHIVVGGKEAIIGLDRPPSEADLQRAREILARLGCGALSSRAYRTLSEGERQRVLIARAMFNSPPLLILDEPCTGLDWLARESYLEALQQLGRDSAGPTMIYVTHRFEEVPPVFNRVLLLKKGRVHSAGCTVELLSPDNLSDFLEIPVEVTRREGRVYVHRKK